MHPNPAAQNIRRTNHLHPAAGKAEEPTGRATGQQDPRGARTTRFPLPSITEEGGLNISPIRHIQRGEPANARESISRTLPSTTSHHGCPVHS